MEAAAAASGGGDKEPDDPNPMEHVDVESSIVQDFQNLQVLNAYNYDQMDDLVKDLTNALDDSVKLKNGHRKEESPSTRIRGHQSTPKKTKRKSKKRKSAAGGQRSDATESSLDEALKDYLENVTQQSDSDDWILSAKCLPNLSAIAKQAIPQVESDSFTENFSPLQPHRHRRRKFKRMAVDLTPESEVLRQSERLKSKAKTHLTSSDNIMAEDSRSRSPVTPVSSSETLPGKRKRGIRGCGNSFEVDPRSEDYCGQCVEANGKGMDCDAKESTSSLSSSECSEARFTGDEGQEGDDEQSDFFFEPGPACGIPGIIPWWEGDALPEPMEKDPNFERILTGSFQHMSQAAQRSFKMRLKQLAKPGREIRAGRRFLKDRRPVYSLSRFLQDRQKWSDACGKKVTHLNWQTSGAVAADTKRRRKTPPNTPTQDGEYVGQHADPIPDSNIGSRLLQSMGWTPGSGLGADGSGITAPLMAYRKHGRKGLGSGGAGGAGGGGGGGGGGAAPS